MKTEGNFIATDKQTASHYLWGDNCDSWVLVDSFYLESEKIIVGEQKGLLIKPGTKHYIANETQEILEFLVISQPTTNQDRTTLE